MGASYSREIQFQTSLSHSATSSRISASEPVKKPTDDAVYEACQEYARSLGFTAAQLPKRNEWEKASKSIPETKITDYQFRVYY